MPETIAALRCAVHPGRAARDRCPSCDRPRCDDDATAYGDRGCGACQVESDERRPRSRSERLIAAGLAGIPVAVVGGWIYSQYVEVHIFSWLVPALIGVAGSSTCAYAWQRGGGLSRPAVAISAVAAVLGTAFGFRLFPHGPHNPLHPANEVTFPYVCAALGAVLWPIALGPPRKPKSPGDDQPA
ncbi:MAG TPA: hypothetical protein VHC43_16385 [Mycobacteriales bacterium]|nr:hypothetical protein [Mycobacteriales bacterium]